MESTQDTILEELNKLLADICRLQQKALHQVLSIEHYLNVNLSSNRAHTQPLVQKQIKQVIQDTQFSIKVDREIDQILNEANQSLKQIQRTGGNKPKLQLKPLPTPQKKPPLPTLNRIVQKKTAISLVPKYVPPKNKNQVTGKVTQTSVICKDKSFKPQIRPHSLQKNINNSTSIQRQQLQSVPLFKKNTKQPILEQNKPISTSQKQLKLPLKLKSPFNLTNFKKSKQQITQQLSNKQTGNKKHILQRMIDQFSANEMGYKTREQKSRDSFLKHLSQLPSTFESTRKWDRCFYTFAFQSLLSRLQALVRNIPDSDTRMDPKQTYRLKALERRLNEELQIILDSANAQVPCKLDLTFSITREQQEQQLEITQIEGKEEVDMGRLYHGVRILLKDIKGRNSLTRESLGKLRAVIEGGLYGSKRCPVLMQSHQYKEWKDFYLD